MKKISALILLGILIASSLGAMENVGMLVLGERPGNVIAAVDRAFDSVVKLYSGSRIWPHNGKKKYLLFGIDDEILLEHIANKPGTDDVYIIDAGCADGSWGKNAMDFLLNCAPGKDKRFFIFSLTGGKEFQSSDCVIEDNVTHYLINSFKIECINEELARHKLSNLMGNVDLIVSNATFRHLTDPLGTLKQMYSLLSPLNGIIIADYFNFKLDDSASFFVFPDMGKEVLANAACLLDTRSSNFILMRSAYGELDIPLQYSGVVQQYRGSEFTSFSKTALFLKEDQAHTEKVTTAGNQIFFYNTPANLSLYDYLKRHQLIRELP